MQKGMTLIETVVWVAVTTSAMLAIVTSVQYFYRTNNYTVEQASAVTSAQRGIESMVKTMREAAYASTGAYPIIAISTSSVAFYADIDSDPFVEQLRFFVDSNTLKRGVVDPVGDPPVYPNTEVISTLSDNIRNIEQGVSAFRYYDVNGNLMTDLSDIAEVRFIEATVVVNINPSRMPNQFTLRSTAALRNLR
jgi:type II secretory pathway pseudopilin PulG